MGAGARGAARADLQVVAALAGARALLRGCPRSEQTVVFSQEQIASLTGLSRSGVSRSLTSLRLGGVVEVRDRRYDGREWYRLLI